MQSDADIMDRIRALHREFGRKRETPPVGMRAWLRRLVLTAKLLCSWVR